MLKISFSSWILPGFVEADSPKYFVDSPLNSGLIRKVCMFVCLHLPVEIAAKGGDKPFYAVVIK